MAGFWTDVNIEPKRQYRWLAYIGGMEPWLCKKMGKPKVVIGETEHKFLNHSFFYPGRAVWDPIQMTLADPVTPNAAGIFFGKLMASGYKAPVNFSQAVSTISKAKSSVGLGNVQIVQLGSRASSDANSDPIETWTLNNCWVKDIAWGELDYGAEEMVDLTVTLRYDYATYTAGVSATAAALGQDGAGLPAADQLPGAGGTFNP